MKSSIALLVSSLLFAASATASVPPMNEVPEPSTLGLFAVAAIAITLLAKFRK